MNASSAYSYYAMGCSLAHIEPIMPANTLYILFDK